MPVTIKVNGMFNSLCHKGSNGIALSTPPDVCKTPSPGGPVPIPYVIISKSSDLKKGTKTVKVDGKKMAAIKGSEFSRCMGDEPGTAKGIISQTNMKEATWILYSFDVKMDGKNACRFMDKMFMNHKNTACLCGELQGPVAAVDMRKVGKTQQEACDKHEENRVHDHDNYPEDTAGIVKQDYDKYREVCKDNNVLVSFRDTNTASLPHLKSGRFGDTGELMESKGHDVLTKSFMDSNLSDDYKHLAGTVSTLDKKPDPGVIIDDPMSKRHLTDAGKPLTGDYDLHEIIDQNGNRVDGCAAGGLTKEKKIRDEMNKAIEAGDTHPRVRHGPQANYAEYAAQHPNEKPVRSLCQPDTNKGDGITVMDGTDGKETKVYRLETNEDVANMYRCKGTEFPPSWRMRTKGRRKFKAVVP